MLKRKAGWLQGPEVTGFVLADRLSLVDTMSGTKRKKWTVKCMQPEGSSNRFDGKQSKAIDRG